MKLKELLGENSHLYFGALNKQKKNKNGGNQMTSQHRAAALALLKKSL
jgi:hypothetical protein